MTKSPLQEQNLPPIPRANLDQTLAKFGEHVFSQLNCHRVGIIESFDATKQVAKIQLVDNWVINTFTGRSENRIEPIVNCPVVFPYGTNGGITFPVTKGDECLVLFNDRNLQNWQMTGAITTPATQRMHSITDAIALVGISSVPNAIPDFNNTYPQLSSPLGGKVITGEKVIIINNAQSLKDLIASLITILQNLKTVNGVSEYPIDAATATALIDLADQFNELLDS